MSEIVRLLGEASEALSNCFLPSLASAVDDAADELERLTRELEEARKDAERYRWLKETFGDCRHGLPNLEAAWDDDIDDFRSIKFWSIKTPEDVDAAIDAAMSQEKRKDALDRMARDADELGLDF